MSLYGTTLDAPGVPFDHPHLRRARPEVVPARVTRARAAVRRQITTRIAAALYARHPVVRYVAVAMGRPEEYVRDLLVAAGVHTPRRKCSAARRAM